MLVYNPLAQVELQNVAELPESFGHVSYQMEG